MFITDFSGSVYSRQSRLLQRLHILSSAHQVDTMSAGEFTLTRGAGDATNGEVDKRKIHDALV